MIDAKEMGHFRVAVCLGFEVSLGAIVREMSLICISIRNFTYMNGCAPGLALKLRHKHKTSAMTGACDHYGLQCEIEANVALLESVTTVSLRPSRVFGPCLCLSKFWYAVSSDWFKKAERV